MARMATVVGIGVLALVVAAADGGDGFDLKTLLATAMVAIVATFGKVVWDRERKGGTWRFSVDAALWGPLDADGNRRQEDGLVAIGRSIRRDVADAKVIAEHAATEAATAADAARQAQRVILEAIADLKRAGQA